MAASGGVITAVVGVASAGLAFRSRLTMAVPSDMVVPPFNGSVYGALSARVLVMQWGWPFDKVSIKVTRRLCHDVA